MADTIPVRQADGFVVTTWWQDESGNGSKGSYDYDWRPTLNDALDLYNEYERGEHPRARAVGIFVVANGLPISGGRIDPAQLMALMAEYPTPRAA
ncbi:MAG: hypothetical protein ACOY4R_27440 [Pseudomonadota bacterium]